MGVLGLNSLGFKLSGSRVPGFSFTRPMRSIVEQSQVCLHMDLWSLDAAAAVEGAVWPDNIHQEA